MKRRSRAIKAGLSPGTLVHIGEREVEHAKISLTDYSPEALRSEVPARAEDAARYLETPSVTWVEVVGLHDVDLLERLGRSFGISRLILEDIVNADHQPKIEISDDFVFILTKRLELGEGERFHLNVEQVSFVIGKGFLLSFQERPGAIFQPVHQRLGVEKGRLRRSGSDYLAYALLDLIVDNHFVVMEKLSDEIDALEERVLGAPDASVPERVHHMKRELFLLRKALWPLREMITTMLRGESSLIQEETHPYLRDLYDHTIHVFDTVETYREMLSGLLELHYANVNARMGEVMKVLTIIATIFIPLTFLAGVYGMNFEYMPELSWPWGYPMILLFMLAAAGGLLVYFRRRHWI
jgi:magnesium transporter